MQMPSYRRVLRGALALLVAFSSLVQLLPIEASPAPPRVVSKWDVFERSFVSLIPYVHPLQDVRFQVTFLSPAGESTTIDGFWDGGVTWKVRFQPDLSGRWTYRTTCSKDFDLGLHGIQGSFTCTAPRGRTPFEQHGPVRVARDGHYLAHQDGTPFFWLGDTAWNGPLKSTQDDWNWYVSERRRQGFSAVQWVTTQWRAAPDGDRDGRLAYEGRERVDVNPRFFRRLDEKVRAMNQAGLLSVPVLLWAIEGGSNPSINPGVSLPEDQAILLARYMVARWGAFHVTWILAGDGDYRGAKAEKWKRIGRGVFGQGPHAPVTMHPGGRMWIMDDFRQESWLDLCGYQSGHEEGDANSRWIQSGPASEEWKKLPARPVFSLEAPYENHLGGPHHRITAAGVRRAHYWSLLNAPPVGVTYGGHGVWGWDNGLQPPVDHPGTGIPLPWAQAVRMPAAEQMQHLGRFFRAMDFWRLRPAPELVLQQPGDAHPSQYVAASRTVAGDLAVFYLPESRPFSLRSELLPANAVATWFNPVTGAVQSLANIGSGSSAPVELAPPGPGDWLLLLRSSTK